MRERLALLKASVVCAEEVPTAETDVDVGLLLRTLSLGRRRCREIGMVGGAGLRNTPAAAFAGRGLRRTHALPRVLPTYYAVFSRI